MRSNILFDLDGTLTDPAEGITNSVRHALDKMEIEYGPEMDLTRFIGPPLDESFRDIFGLEEEAIHKAIGYFREYFADKGLYQNYPFEGMAEMLQNLCGEGFTLYIATSKPQIFAEKVLEMFDMAQYFANITGSPLNDAGTSKDEIIRISLETNSINPETAIMVGDRKHDILGAAKNGIPSVGVLFGYGDRQEHTAAGATYIAEDIGRLYSILIEAGREEN